MNRREILNQLAKRDGGFKCVHCGSTKNLSIDHIVPKSSLGADIIENMQILCRSCNSRKGTRRDKLGKLGTYADEYYFRLYAMYQEYDPNLPNYPAGTKVYHRKFGLGVVIDGRKRQDGDTELRIRFTDGVKRIMAEFAKLEIVSNPSISPSNAL